MEKGKQPLPIHNNTHTDSGHTSKAFGPYRNVIMRFRTDRTRNMDEHACFFKICWRSILCSGPASSAPENLPWHHLMTPSATTYKINGNPEERTETYSKTRPSLENLVFQSYCMFHQVFSLGKRLVAPENSPIAPIRVDIGINKRLSIFPSIEKHRYSAFATQLGPTISQTNNLGVLEGLPALPTHPTSCRGVAWNMKYTTSATSCNYFS